MKRSLESLRKHHPNLPVHVHTLPDDLDPVAGLLEKSRMMDVSPFETTLFLDADTVVMGPLDFGFDRAERFGLACAVCECPWARRYAGLADRGDVVEYNTGVLFFSKAAAPVFDRWKTLAPTLDSASLNVVPGTKSVSVMPYNDQAAFACAVAEADFPPAVLPMNWNFRPRWQNSFFGPLRIWHDYTDVPQSILDVNAYYADTPNAVYQVVRFSVE